MWILLAMIAVMPFEVNPYVHLADSFLGVFPDFTLIKLLGLLGLGWCLVEVACGRVQLKLLQTGQGQAFLGFLTIVLLAGVVRGVGLVTASRLLSVALFLPIVLVAVRSEADLWRALKMAVLVMVLVFPYAYRQVLRFGGRLGVGLYEPNYFALALLLLLPLAVVFRRAEPHGWRRLLWTAAAGILGLEIILTGSRGAFLGLVVVGGLVALRLARRRILGVAALAVLVIGVFLLPTSLGHRLRATGLDPGTRDTASEASVEVRLHVLRAGLRMIQGNPLLGVGLGNFKAASLTYGSSVDKTAHNTYVEVAAELGLPALLAFLVTIGAAFRSLGRSRRLAAEICRGDLAELAMSLQIGLVGFLVAGAFLSAQFEKFFWLLMFLTVSLERIVAASTRGVAGNRAG